MDPLFNTIYTAMDSPLFPSLYGRAGMHNVDWPRAEFVHVLRHLFFMTRLKISIIALYERSSEHPKGMEGLKSALVYASHFQVNFGNELM